MMHIIPNISNRTKHLLMIGAAASVVIVTTFLLVNKTGEPALGIDPGSMSSGLGGFGDLLRKMLGSGAALGTGSGTGGLSTDQPDLPLPPIGQTGQDYSTNIDTTQPAPQTTSSAMNTFKQQLTDFLAPSPQPDPVAPTPQIADAPIGWTPVYNGSSYADTVPTYDNGLLMPAGTILPDNAGIAQSDIVLTPIVGGTGNLAQDPSGNIYQTSLPPTSGPDVPLPADYGVGTVGGTWNPAMGHDPGNPQDTN